MMLFMIERGDVLGILYVCDTLQPVPPIETASTTTARHSPFCSIPAHSLTRPLASFPFKPNDHKDPKYEHEE
jgi:hypothetical protein